MFRLVVALLVCLIALGASVAVQAQDLAAKSSEAAAAMRAKRFERAAELYRELKRAIPDNPGLTMNLGLALHSSGRYEAALEQFGQVVRLDPSMGPAWLLLGVGNLKLGRSSAALAPLEKAVELLPDNTLALLELGDTLLQQERFDQAAVNFQKLMKLDSANPKGWLGLGSSYASLSRISAERLEAVAPESGYRDLLVADSRFDLDQYRSAFAYYRRAAEKLPEMPGVHQSLARVYRAAGHEEWARVEDEREKLTPTPDCRAERLLCSYRDQAYEQVVASEQSQEPQTLYLRTKAYSALAERAHARLAALPLSSAIHQVMATQLHMRGQYREAVEEWRRALEFEPSNAALRTKLAHSVWSSGDYEAAQPMLEELLEITPESAQLHFMLGHGLLSRQLNEDAIAPLEDAVRLDPEMLEARGSLARAYLRISQPEQAIPHLEAALPTDADGSLHYQLARAYQTAGRAADARKAMADYKQALESIQQRESASASARPITAP